MTQAIKQNESPQAGSSPAIGSADVPEAYVIVANAYHRLREQTEARGGDHPPPAKKGWKHSEMVLVYYAPDPEADEREKWSIAYYHHDPPFEDKPSWVDFNTSRGAPDHWWPLPELPNTKLTDSSGQ